MNAGVSVKITPWVHQNQQINLAVEMEYKTVSGYRIEHQLEMPIFASRKTNMSLQVSANATIVFAGLFDQSNHSTIEKVPLLGDIPIVGSLFQRSVIKKRSSDLIYKITPTLEF